MGAHLVQISCVECVSCVTLFQAILMGVLDGLAEFLEENGAVNELEAYIREHSRVVSLESDEQTHASFRAYQGYVELLRSVLADFVEESRRDLHLVGLAQNTTVEGLVDALRQERACRLLSDVGTKFREFISVTSFEEFAEEARKWLRHQQHKQPQVEAADPLRFDPPQRVTQAAA